jgi:hypothetical protein
VFNDGCDEMIDLTAAPALPSSSVQAFEALQPDSFPQSQRSYHASKWSHSPMIALRHEMLLDDT